MKVTKIHIASYRGANKQPSSGDVWFDDGKSYGWSRSQDDGQIFFSMALKETSFRSFRGLVSKTETVKFGRTVFMYELTEKTKA